MLIAACIIIYILIGIYSGFKNEPWWWRTMGCHLQKKHSSVEDYLPPSLKTQQKEWICYKCAAKDPEWTQDHLESGRNSAIFSGILWPFFPVIKLSMDVRNKLMDADQERAKRKAEDEQELRDAEDEMNAPPEDGVAKNKTEPEEN